jgi:hypothetical protein
VLQHVALRDEIIGAHLVDQTVLQVINEAQQKVGCIVFLSQVVDRKSVARPEHHAPQMIGTYSLGLGQEFNDDGFAGLVSLHETARDALLQLHLTPGKREPPFIVLLTLVGASRHQIKPTDDLFLGNLPIPKMVLHKPALGHCRPTFERYNRDDVYNMRLLPTPRMMEMMVPFFSTFSTFGIPRWGFFCISDRTMLMES